MSDTDQSIPEGRPGPPASPVPVILKAIIQEASGEQTGPDQFRINITVFAETISHSFHIELRGKRLNLCHLLNAIPYKEGIKLSLLKNTKCLVQCIAGRYCFLKAGW